MSDIWQCVHSMPRIHVTRFCDCLYEPAFAPGFAFAFIISMRDMNLEKAPLKSALILMFTKSIRETYWGCIWSARVQSLRSMAINTREKTSERPERHSYSSKFSNCRSLLRWCTSETKFQWLCSRDDAPYRAQGLPFAAHCSAARCNCLHFRLQVTHPVRCFFTSQVLQVFLRV